MGNLSLFSDLLHSKGLLNTTPTGSETSVILTSALHTDNWQRIMLARSLDAVLIPNIPVRISI